jgi:hypothetical protein
MNFDPKEHLYDSGKKTMLLAADLVCKHPEQVSAYHKLAFADVKQYSARAARVICFAGEQDFSIVEPYRDKMIWQLFEMKNKSAMMSILKLFTFCPLPKDDELIGRLTSFCFDMMQSTTERPALRVYPMEILYRISNIEPIIKQELAMVISQLAEYGTAGFKAWSRKTLKRLEKEMEKLPESFFENFDEFDDF